MLREYTAAGATKYPTAGFSHWQPEQQQQPVLAPGRFRAENVVYVVFDKCHERSQGRGRKCMFHTNVDLCVSVESQLYSMALMINGILTILSILHIL